MKNNNPGRSARTPAKHELLDKLVGQEIGAAPYLTQWGPPPDRVVLIDLCAGDARLPIDAVDLPLRKDGDWWYNTSPSILTRNARGSKDKGPQIEVLIDLYEINRANFDALIENLTAHLGAPRGRNNDGAVCWPQNGRGVTVRAAFGSGSDAALDRIHSEDTVFITNDPNNIHQWAMRPTMLQEVYEKTRWCRTFSTLGCNVGGLKMLPLEERLPWYGHVLMLKDALPPNHDLVLAAIEDDASQWAYAITTPIVWRPKTTATIDKAFRDTIGKNMKIWWWRESPGEFKELEDFLFLTGTERGKR